MTQFWSWLINNWKKAEEWKFITSWAWDKETTPQFSFRYPLGTWTTKLHCMKRFIIGKLYHLLGSYVTRILLHSTTISDWKSKILRMINVQMVHLKLGKRILRVVKGGSRSRFTENKTVLSQFTKNKDIMKITVHGELNTYFSFHGK